MILLRREIGDVLRSARQHQGRTLREVSGAARVSLGYLSEVERGQKEASSELLFSICHALEVPMSTVLREVSDRVAAVESPTGTLSASIGSAIAAPIGVDVCDDALAAVTLAGPTPTVLRPGKLVSAA